MDAKVEGSSSGEDSRKTTVLIIAIFIAGLCSIIYQLLISTVSSYFLGDSVRQFSITIGLYMAALGLGSYLSRNIEKNLVYQFVRLEILLSLLGGICVPALYGVYAYAPEMYLASMAFLALSIGLLVGFEIPLLTRLLENTYTLKINISNVLSLDYFGALVATLMFPFLLLPLAGVFRSALIFGLVNLAMAVMVYRVLGPREKVHSFRYLKYPMVLVGLILISSLWGAGVLVSHWSSSLYEDRVLMDVQSRYQRITLTRGKDDIRLFLNGNLQFSSLDEHRYHESLIHLPVHMYSANGLRQVLILGGGDGLAARELLKYKSVRQITVVDLDPQIVELSRTNALIKKLNQGSLEDPRVHIVNMDARTFLEDTPIRYDAIFSDLPDPNNTSLAKLYSKEFYRLVKQRLNVHGFFVTQATSPYYASEAFWTIAETLKAAEFGEVTPYHVNVPSFGEWGFVTAAESGLNEEHLSRELSVQTRFLEEKTIPSMLLFDKDLRTGQQQAQVSTLDNPMAMYRYQQGWHYWK